MKTQILAAIGAKELQPAASLNAALAANDRVKYVFSLLQMALAHADHPDQPATTLKRVHLELGGKAPVVVFDDVELESALETIAGTGQGRRQKARALRPGAQRSRCLARGRPARGGGRPHRPRRDRRDDAGRT